MPFKSKAQRRACYAKQDPNWDCEKWDEYEMSLKSNRKLTEKERESLPASAFLLPKYRKLPYRDVHGDISLGHVKAAIALAHRVRGVPKGEVRRAEQRAREILVEHGGDPDEIRMARNGYWSKSRDEDLPGYPETITTAVAKERWGSDWALAKDDYEDATRRLSMGHIQAIKFADEGVMKKNPGLQRNFFRRKAKAPPTAAELEAERVAEVRSTRVWRDKFRYFNISEGYGKAQSEQLADESTEEYWAQRRRQKESGIARNGTSMNKSDAKTLASRLYNRGYEDIEIMRDPEGGSGYVVQAYNAETRGWDEYATKDYRTPTLVHNRRRRSMRRNGKNLTRTDARKLARRLQNKGYDDIEVMPTPDGPGYVVQAYDQDSGSWHEYTTADYSAPTYVHNKRRGRRSRK